MVFKKGDIVAPHKEGCSCPRCSRVPWNKGIKTGIKPSNAFEKGHDTSIDTREKIRKAHLGKKYKKMSIYLLNK